MLRTTEFAHLLMRQSVKPGDWVVDATVGNGHDTLLLAKLVGPTGRVIGFDVQEASLAAATERVDGMPQVTLIHAGHEKLTEHLPVDGHERLAAVMFNLGYLPGASKEIMTRSETTLAALKQAFTHLKMHGLVTLVLYPGHPGGEEEAEAVRSYAQQLPQAFAVTQHARINTLRPAPELIVIERLS
jgi:predicted methyltransferase